MKTGAEVKHLSSSLNAASASAVQENRGLPTVEVGEAKEGLKLLNLHRCRPLCQACTFPGEKSSPTRSQ